MSGLSARSSAYGCGIGGLCRPLPRACFRHRGSNFLEELEGVGNAAVKAVLLQLCQLYALSHLQDNLGGCIGLVTPAQVQI